MSKSVAAASSCGSRLRRLSDEKRRVVEMGPRGGDELNLVARGKDSRPAACGFRWYLLTDDANGLLLKLVAKS